MTDTNQPAPPTDAQAPQQPYDPAFASPAAPQAMAQYGYAPAAYGVNPAAPIGKIRGTGVCILLSIVTFGIYSLVWYYQVHSEMRRHSGQGLDGGIALILAFFVSIVMPFITASEVGALHERRGHRKPVSGVTGLWYVPGMIILVGPLIWFIKTNGALNAYWRSLGAV